MVNALSREYEIVRKKFADIKDQNYRVMGELLGDNTEENDYISSVSRYNETRVASSQVNAVLANLLIQHINTLIHHLLRAGENISTSKAYGVNLVVFRVSDLMRSKWKCSEGDFIALLKTMYLLENDPSMKDKFKIVRIKNKLDDPANNIMINYLFMGRVQCELQLSTQEAKGKQKNYFTFSHFVYELTRGMFGPVAECAIMVSQLDPMIAGCRKARYS